MARTTPPLVDRVVFPSLVVLALSLSATAASAQNAPQPPGRTALVIDPVRSMVWWQLDPHFGHLWATTCPRDPSWQPGEGHSPGYYVNYANRPGIKTTKVAEQRIPLFPRGTVRPLCRQAVTGSITIGDSAQFTGLRGHVDIDPDSITMGADARDYFSRKYVYKKATNPSIGFSIDSLTSISISGDTVSAVAHGVFEFRGVRTPRTVGVTGVKESAGMRVRGMFSLPARDITDRYGVSRIVLGAGIGLKLWDTLYLGFDLILTPEDTGGTS